MATPSDKADTPEAAAGRLRKLLDEVAQDEAVATRRAAKLRRVRIWAALVFVLAAGATLLFLLYYFGMLRVK